MGELWQLCDSFHRPYHLYTVEKFVDHVSLWSVDVKAQTIVSVTGQALHLWILEPDLKVSNNSKIWQEIMYIAFTELPTLTDSAGKFPKQ